MKMSLKALEELKTYEEQFGVECRVVNEVKCYLLNNRKLDGYTYEGNEIYGYGDHYELNVEGYSFIFEISDDVLMDYECSRA